MVLACWGGRYSRLLVNALQIQPVSSQCLQFVSGFILQVVPLTEMLRDPVFLINKCRV